jgi:hypothetical protein
MQTEIGDEIVVDGVKLGDPSRKGEILEVLDRSGVRHYVVRWDDGRETTFYPGSTTHVVHLKGSP